MALTLTDVTAHVKMVVPLLLVIVTVGVETSCVIVILVLFVQPVLVLITVNVYVPVLANELFAVDGELPPDQERFPSPVPVTFMEV